MDCFGNLEGTGSTLFSGGLFGRQLRFGGNWLHIIFRQIVLEAAQIWQELAPYYFPTDCFGDRSNLEGTGSTLFSGRLFLENWRELAPHYFLADCYKGSSDLVGTGSMLFLDRLFGRRLRFGGNWLHNIFRKIVLEAGQIWRELAPHYFPADCFGGSSNLVGTCSTLFSNRLFWRQLILFSDRLFWRQLKFGGNCLYIIIRQIVLEIWRELAPHYFPADCFGGSSDLVGAPSTLVSERLFGRQVKF